ncbi:hypothetical protein PAMC26510_12220 [Caballeronia sordidicola]|uniref:Uncharacterized protein n=1 Tax=Caballeronia sordidicola TaxID=196367 RepID=A0A242MXH3_CABSO|nr:hypothetical protein PAMC26577_19040 [Caballeronia sordidicola]OTP76085.1 hypothetical protein PAMC26510_12220 [Caballeronia sordidicola]
MLPGKASRPGSGRCSAGVGHGSRRDRGRLAWCPGRSFSVVPCPGDAM